MALQCFLGGLPYRRGGEKLCCCAARQRCAIGTVGRAGTKNNADCVCVSRSERFANRRIGGSEGRVSRLRYTQRGLPGPLKKPTQVRARLSRNCWSSFRSCSYGTPQALTDARC